MEPDILRINNEYKEKQRLKNVQEYQKKFFKKLEKHNFRNNGGNVR